jgi:hypothetical protein
VSATKYSSPEKATEEQTRFDNQQAKKAIREADKAKKKKKTSKNDDEGNLSAAADMVQAKLEELVAKGGAADKGADKGAEGGAGVEAMVGGKVEKKADH